MLTNDPRVHYQENENRWNIFANLFLVRDFLLNHVLSKKIAFVFILRVQSFEGMTLNVSTRRFCLTTNCFFLSPRNVTNCFSLFWAEFSKHLMWRRELTCKVFPECVSGNVSWDHSGLWRIYCSCYSWKFLHYVIEDVLWVGNECWRPFRNHFRYIRMVWSIKTCRVWRWNPDLKWNQLTLVWTRMCILSEYEVKNAFPHPPSEHLKRYSPEKSNISHFCSLKEDWVFLTFMSFQMRP